MASFLSPLLDSDDDWIEDARLYLYPRLHAPLSSVGDRLGIPLYAVGHVGDNQYVGLFDESEDAIEDELDERGERNPFAGLKELPDGRTSEGSWVVLHQHAPELIEPGMQLHFTLFAPQDGSRGRELHAHYEDDWRERPIPHLRAKNFSASEGVAIAEEYVNEHTHLVLQ